MQKYYMNGQLQMHGVLSFNLTNKLASDIKIIFQITFSCFEFLCIFYHKNSTYFRKVIIDTNRKRLSAINLFRNTTQTQAYMYIAKRVVKM